MQGKEGEREIQTKLIMDDKNSIKRFLCFDISKSFL